MTYWAEVMQDDAYQIAAEGWKAETSRVIERKKGKDGKEKVTDKGWTCDLVPKDLLVARYYAEEAAAIAADEAERERVIAEMQALEEEHGSEDGLFAELVEDGELSINDARAKARLKEIKGDKALAGEAFALNEWLKLSVRDKELKKEIREAEADLDDLAYAHYPRLNAAAVQALVVDDKWMASMEARIGSETARVAQALTRRVKELGERYTDTLPTLAGRVAELERKVGVHLKAVGFA